MSKNDMRKIITLLEDSYRDSDTSDMFPGSPEQKAPSDFDKEQEYGDVTRPQKYDALKQKMMDKFKVGDRVSFRPHGIYPFWYKNKPTKAFPDSNQVFGTIKAIVPSLGQVEVALEKPIRIKRDGKPYVKSTVYVDWKEPKVS